jgi:hypothetical protein
MNDAEQSPGHVAIELVGTMLRIWAVGFVVAAKGTAWLIARTVRLLYPARSTNGPGNHRPGP